MQKKQRMGKAEVNEMHLEGVGEMHPRKEARVPLEIPWGLVMSDA